MSSKVQLYIYDLTQGLAAQLSPMFLGKTRLVIDKNNDDKLQQKINCLS